MACAISAPAPALAPAMPGTPGVAAGDVDTSLISGRTGMTGGATAAGCVAAGGLAATAPGAARATGCRLRAATIHAATR